MAQIVLTESFCKLVVLCPESKSCSLVSNFVWPSQTSKLSFTYSWTWFFLSDILT